MADVEEPIAADEPVEVEAEETEAVEEKVVVEEEEFVAVGGAAEVKLFGKWSFDDIEIRDISLVVSDSDSTSKLCKTLIRCSL
jgi:small subunit ribosomal protein S5e